MTLKPIARMLDTVYYWLRTHTVHRYHIVDMRCPHNDYKWGWLDRSDAIIFACFAILVDYVEKEMRSDWDWVDHILGGEDIEKFRVGLEDENYARHNAHLDLLALYLWWTKGRAEEHAEWYVAAKERNERRDLLVLEERDDEMLQKLLSLRNYMWT